MGPDPVFHHRLEIQRSAGGIDQGLAIRGPVILTGALLDDRVFLERQHIHVMDRPRAHRLRVQKAVGQGTAIR